MARSLEQLQKQYNSSAPSKNGRGPMGGPMRGGPRGRNMGPVSKPKNVMPTIKRLLHYVSDFKVHIIIVILCMLLSTVTSLIGSYMLFPIINRIARVETTVENSGGLAVKADGFIEKIHDKMFPLFEELLKNDRYADITVYVISALGVLLIVYIVGIVASYLQHRIMLSVTQGALERIRNDLFAKLQNLPVRYFDTHPTGEIMSRFTNDVDTIGVMFDTSLLSIISGLITLVGTFVFMITTNWVLTLVTIVFIPIFIKGGKLITSRSRKYFSGQQAALGAVNGYIEESVSGQKVVKVFNREDECVAEFEALNQDLRDKQFKAQFVGGIMGPIMGNTGQISYAATVGIGGIMMVTSGFTPGALTVFAQYSRQFSFPINNISNQINTIFSALAGAERVFAVMDSEPEAPSSADALRDAIEGEVVFKDVTFGYNPDKVVLKNISLYAKKGQKIAFVGSTGAGKTTITNLLNRFYDIEQGEITIDGKPLKSYDREYLRKNIAMVLQDTHLFTGTVMENIRYGRLDATDDEVIAAAKTASAHSFITRLSDGYNTVLEGDGANLSQGQRQLINIARAALSKAPILVLDEATSSVDTRTERHIEHGMDRLMSNRTTFVIAHRLSTVRNSSAIMVLEKGEIIERGTHEQLLELGGRYYELYTGMKELD